MEINLYIGMETILYLALKLFATLIWLCKIGSGLIALVKVLFVNASIGTVSCGFFIFGREWVTENIQPF